MSFPPPSLPPLGPAPAPAPGPAPRPTPPPEVPVFAPLSPPKAAPKAVLTVQPPPPPAPLLPPSALAEPPPLKERFRAALAANKVDTTVPELIFQHPKELVPELILLLKTQPAPAPLNLIVATITTKVIELGKARVEIFNKKMLILSSRTTLTYFLMNLVNWEKTFRTIELVVFFDVSFI